MPVFHTAHLLPLVNENENERENDDPENPERMGEAQPDQTRDAGQDGKRQNERENPDPEFG
jgi:hypothetical protein